MDVLLLILFAIIEFGRILGAYMIIHDLARDAVRFGVVGKNDTFIENYIESHDYYLDIANDGEITITPSYSSREVGEPLTVRIDYEEEIITPIISSIVPNPIEMSAEYVMRIETK